MDKASQHWQILNRLDGKFRDKVGWLMTIGERADGALLVTNEGDGYWIGEMQFGNDSKSAMEPTRLGVTKLVKMAHGRSHIVLLDSEGRIHTLGKNNCGQLGLKKTDEETHFEPQMIASRHKFIEVRCGSVHSLALTDDGKVWAWGGNLNGQIGIHSGTTIAQTSLQQVFQLNSHRVTAIECGGAHSMALTDKGEMYAWGWSYYGQVGHNKCDPNVSDMQMHTPVRMVTTCPIKQMAGGRRHSLLLTQSGEVYACGWNKYGQLGLKKMVKCHPNLHNVTGLPPISEIASHFGTSLSIAMSFNRECYVWGYLDNRTSTSVPLKLPAYYTSIYSTFASRPIQCNMPYSASAQEFATVEISSKTDSITQTESLSESNELLDETLDSKLKGKQYTDSNTQTEIETSDPAQSRPQKLVNVIAQIFDNPDSSPDVKFVFGNQTILAHRCLLQFYSAHFSCLFATESASYLPVEIKTATELNLPQPDVRHTTNPSNAEPDSESESDSESIPTIPTPNSSNLDFPMTTIRITPYSYHTFYAYLRFIYTGILVISPENLTELFELANISLESELKQLCITRMISTVSLETCCQYYQFADQFELNQLKIEIVKFIAENPFEVFRSEAYRLMNMELSKKLTLAISEICR